MAEILAFFRSLRTLPLVNEKFSKKHKLSDIAGVAIFKNLAWMSSRPVAFLEFRASSDF